MIPPALLQSHAHRLTLELAAEQLAREVEAVRIACSRLHRSDFTNAVSVWCADHRLPFSSVADAARLVRDMGATAHSVHTAAQNIRRAANKGATAYGLRWKLRLDQPDAPAYQVRRTSRAVVVGGVVYPSLTMAAGGQSRANAVYKRRWMRIYRALKVEAVADVPGRM